MLTPVVTRSAQLAGLVHVVVPELAIALHVDTRRRVAAITWRGVLVREVPFARA